MAVARQPFSLAYQETLDGPRAARKTPGDAFTAARATWLAGERLDMAALAASLGISRPTLYKWCGPREQLLTDVIWSVTETTVDHVVADSKRKRGVNRLVHVCTRCTAILGAAPPLNAYLRNETHAAVRLLTARGGFHNRLVDKLAQFISDEAARSSLTLKADPQLLSYAIVRTMEGLIYNDAIAAVDLRLDEAPALVRLILT